MQTAAAPVLNAKAIFSCFRWLPFREEQLILIIIFAIVGAGFAFEWAIIGAPGAVLCLVGGILFFIEPEVGGA